MLAAEAERTQREASASMREAVDVLRGLGFAVRDVGTMLGVSHQGVGQLEEAPAKKSPAKKSPEKKAMAKPLIAAHLRLTPVGGNVTASSRSGYAAAAKASAAHPSAPRKPK